MINSYFIFRGGGKIVPLYGMYRDTDISPGPFLWCAWHRSIGFVKPCVNSVLMYMIVGLILKLKWWAFIEI